MTAAVLEWSYNPWRQRPTRAAGAVLATALCVLLLLVLPMPGLMAIGLGFVIVPPFGAAFLPARYRIDEAGVTRRFGWLIERRPWERVRRAVRLPGEILLTPMARRSYLDAVLGLHVATPPGVAPAGDLDRILASHGL